MPEIMDALRAAQESRTVNHVSPAIQNGLKELAVILGVVLEVGVLNQHDVTAGRFKTAAQCGSLTAILGLKDKADILQGEARVAILHDGIALACRLGLVEFLEQQTRAVGGSIVDDNNLLV